MEIWEYIILFLSVVIGGGVAFYVNNYNRNILQLVLSFVGAYILGISVLHLMPGIFSEHSHYIGIWILLGFFIQIVLEQLSGGVEHGHIHPSRHASPSFAIQVMLGLCVHAFIEGMPLDNYDSFHAMIHGEEHGHNHLFYGIILHKAPAAFVLVLLLIVSKYKRPIIIASLLCFALMSPLGALLGGFLDFSPDVMRKLLAVVVGSFLHISTTILFEVENPGHHHVSFKKLVVIAVGLLAALLTVEF